MAIHKSIWEIPVRTPFPVHLRMTGSIEFCSLKRLGSGSCRGSRRSSQHLPQPLRRQRSAFGLRGQFHPHDIAVNLDPSGEGAESAIDAGDHIFSPDYVGVVDDSVGDQFGMLDKV